MTSGVQKVQGFVPRSFFPSALLVFEIHRQNIWDSQCPISKYPPLTMKDCILDSLLPSVIWQDPWSPEMGIPLSAASGEFSFTSLRTRKHMLLGNSH